MLAKTLGTRSAVALSAGTSRPCLRLFSGATPSPRLTRRLNVREILDNVDENDAMLGRSLVEAGATREDVTKSFVSLARKGKYQQVVTAHNALQGETAQLSPLLGDGALQAIMQSYAVLQRPNQVRQLIRHIQDQERYMSKNISVLISAYCLSDRFAPAEELLSRWLSVWLQVQSDANPQAADFSKIIAETLTSSNNGKAASVDQDIQPPLDVGNVEQLLALMQSRNKEAVGEAQNTALLNAIDGNVLATTWPDASVWASVARLYSLRHAYKETKLVLDILIDSLQESNTDARVLSSSAKQALSSVCYNTVRVMCDSGQYHLAVDVLTKMRSVNFNPSPWILNRLFTYMKGVDNLDTKLLVPLLVNLRELHEQEKITSLQFGALADSLLSLLCKHGLASDAAEFIMNTTGKRVLRAITVTTVIDGLILNGKTEQSVEIFRRMVDPKSALHDALDPKVKPGIAVAIDFAYHHICKGLRRHGTTVELAHFTMLYGESTNTDK